ncbi:hypothetical protein J2853_008706 [Streptosporangium lutulentum]|uniref:Uncharacterized protein n=1 Tax=Streptosporangium lutulentum TaxID=1461250 RepID=A0ABT9QRX0_9ACTN|nr:hypothetical protein [Streptosporangium lutulentum]
MINYVNRVGIRPYQRGIIRPNHETGPTRDPKIRGPEPGGWGPESEVWVRSLGPEFEVRAAPAPDRHPAGTERMGG